MFHWFCFILKRWYFSCVKSFREISSLLPRQQPPLDSPKDRSGPSPPPMLRPVPPSQNKLAPVLPCSVPSNKVRGALRHETIYRVWVLFKCLNYNISGLNIALCRAALVLPYLVPSNKEGDIELSETTNIIEGLACFKNTTNLFCFCLFLVQYSFFSSVFAQGGRWILSPRRSERDLRS